MSDIAVKFYGEDPQTKRRIYRARYPNGSIFEYTIDGFYSNQVEKNLPHKPGAAANVLQDLVKQGQGTEVRLAMKTIDKFTAKQAQEEQLAFPEDNTPVDPELKAIVEDLVNFIVSGGMDDGPRNPYLIPVVKAAIAVLVARGGSDKYPYLTR